MSSTWRIEDEALHGRDVELSSGDGTVGLSFIRATLRRKWYLWLGSTILGVALAGAWLTLVPAPSTGTVTLLLAHDPGADAETAMETDVRLLTTRTVAQDLLDELGSGESPDDLIETIVAVPATSSVLNVDIRGTDGDDAVLRASLLAEKFMDYRAQQLTQQSRAVTDGYQGRIDALQVQVDGLTAQYDAILARGGSDAEVAEVLGQRSQLISEITRLQNEIETTTLDSNALVVASRVLDEASLVPQSPLKRGVLGIGSGLVGGLGLGLALIVVYAITTGRLRSRADVATAMGLPVAFSTGALSSRWRRTRVRHQAAVDGLVDGLVTALPTGKPPRRLSVVTVDCEREGAAVLAGLARRLGADGSVLAVDLAETGLLDRELASSSASADDGPRIAVVSGTAGETVADVVLTLAPFDIGRGLTHLKSRGSRCVVLVKAGESTAERLSTVARSATSAGLDVRFVMLVGADRSDQSFGGE